MGEDLNGLKNYNQYGQPIGESLDDWTPRLMPQDITLCGSTCTVEPLNADRHAADLFRAYSLVPDARDWTYMFAGPFKSEVEYRTYAVDAVARTDARPYAVIDNRTGQAVGVFSLMRIDPGNGVIEVGNVAFSVLLSRRVASTEAQFLLMQYVFENLRYRRYEWKCDALNAPSRKTAERLGFQFEGIFRQAIVYKGRARDTSWYSITHKEWPLIKSGFQKWLSSENFDAEGRQLRKLESLRRLANKST